MSKKHDLQIKKWQYLIKEFQDSGMKLKDWCAANDISKDKYYYWLNKVRVEYYEEAVKQLQPTEKDSKAIVPLEARSGSFVEIKPEIIGETLQRGNLNMPAAVVQKGSIRVEIMQSASTSFIRQLLEAMRYA